MKHVSFAAAMSLLLVASLLGAAAARPGDVSAADWEREAKVPAAVRTVADAFRILPSKVAEVFPSFFPEEDNPAEPETEGETESLGTVIYPVERVAYLDASKNKKELITDPFAPRNDYDKDLFVLSNGRMEYRGEGYRSRLGIDVSHHQGLIDWERVAAAGIEFAILRIGYRGYGPEGKVREDSLFERNLKGAKEAGLDVGVYFFAQAVTVEEAGEEAAFVLDILDGRELALPVVYDPESVVDASARTDGVPGEQFTVNTRVFCDMVKAAGYQPMVYANLRWEDEFLDMAALADVPMWYADYEEKPQSPYCFDFWQYTSHGYVAGIGGRVDMDVQLVPE